MTLDDYQALSGVVAASAPNAIVMLPRDVVEALLAVSPPPAVDLERAADALRLWGMERPALSVPYAFEVAAWLQRLSRL